MSLPKTKSAASFLAAASLVLVGFLAQSAEAAPNGNANGHSTASPTATAKAKSQTLKASGGGWYTFAPKQKATLAFQANSTLPAGGTVPSIKGNVTWNVSKLWKFKGQLTSFTVNTGLGQATGTGTLSYWVVTNGTGAWVSVTGKPVTVTFKFTANSKNSKGKPVKGTFGIGFTTSDPLVSGVPTLPTLPEVLVAVGGGNISIK